MTVLRLSPLPDEFAAGYQGRMFRHNGWTDAKEAMRALLAWTGNKDATRREVSTVELLARAAGKEVGQFVRDHTLVPLRRAVTTTALGVPHGSEAQTSLLCTLAMRSLRSGAHLCVECVKEDYGFHGMPYWRREHQLPGRYWCLKHGCRLSHTSSNDAYSRSPTDFIEVHQVVSEPWLHGLKQSRPIERFLAICSDLLSSRHPLDELHVSRTARARATELGLHTGRGTIRRPLVSDRVKRQFDRIWLNSVVPGLIDCPYGTYWQPVDAAVFGKRAGVSAIAYSLVFAVLYESADAAIRAMLSPPNAEAPCRLARSRSSAVDDTRLRKAYLASQGSHMAAAAQVHVSRDLASRRLKALGLPALCGQKANAIHGVIADALRGDMNLREACIAHGLSPTAMQHILRAALTPLTQALGKIQPLKPRSPGTPRRGRRPVPPPMHRAEQTASIYETAEGTVARRRNHRQRAIMTAA